MQEALFPGGSLPFEPPNNLAAALFPFIIEYEPTATVNGHFDIEIGSFSKFRSYCFILTLKKEEDLHSVVF